MAKKAKNGGKSKPVKGLPPKSQANAAGEAMAKLSNKQQTFVREYLIDKNATGAAARAGYKQANKQGPRLLVNVGIAAAIAEAMNARAKRMEITADRVVEEMARLAFVDIGEILDFSGDQTKLRPARDIPENARRALASMKVKRYLEGHGEDAKDVEVTEFKLWDKLPALVKLGEQLGLFVKKVEHSGKDGGAIPIQIVGVEIVEPKEAPDETPV